MFKSGPALRRTVCVYKGSCKWSEENGLSQVLNAVREECQQITLLETENSYFNVG